MSSTSGTTVTSASASVNGAQTSVLTGPDGHTLYYFTPDTAGGKPTCTGSCASIWPALTATSPTGSATATGTLTVVSGQVVYNGHPLYEFTGDSAAGQANGEGTGGKWYVATPTLATGAGPATTTPSSPSSPSSSSTSGGGGGYGY
jgi:predicted lipoprotein with Yx(FWY)xxD motif